MNTIQEAVLNDISSVQGELFMCLNKKGYNYKNFISDYMNSRFCNMAMDALYSDVQLMMPEELLYFIEKEITLTPDPFGKHPVDIVMFNVGYMYRYVARKHDIASKDLYAKLPCEKMEKLIDAHIDDYEYEDYEREILAIISN